MRHATRLSVAPSLQWQAGYERGRIVCIRGDSNPPAAWRLWAPAFCSRVFVREMHLGW